MEVRAELLLTRNLEAPRGEGGLAEARLGIASEPRGGRADLEGHRALVGSK
jgi:hypothetical protein